MLVAMNVVAGSMASDELSVIETRAHSASGRAK